MRIVTILIVLASLNVLVSTANAKDVGPCYNNFMFEDEGWIIHDPEDFDDIYVEKMEELELNLDDGLVSFDMEGLYRSRYTVVYKQIMLQQTWLANPKNYVLKYGDMVFTHVDKSYTRPAEVRWLAEDGSKNIVYSLEEFYCIPTKTPLAFNSLF